MILSQMLDIFLKVHRKNIEKCSQEVSKKKIHGNLRKKKFYDNLPRNLVKNSNDSHLNPAVDSQKNTAKKRRTKESRDS